MKFASRFALCAVLAGAVAGSLGIVARVAAAEPAPVFRDIAWSALVPKGWDPSQGVAGKNVGAISDTDPRSWKLMKQMRAIWDNAPTVGSLEGARVRMPGYVVPLESVRGELQEFLLVPYFGACIHTPPPPANQIVYVTTDKPVKGFASMDTVWVSGVLHTTRQDSLAGTSGYRLDAVAVTRYVGEPHY